MEVKKVIPIHPMKRYKGVDAQLYSFSTLWLRGIGQFHPKKTAPVVQWTEIWVGTPRCVALASANNARTPW
jgi:hypothetical protein